MDSINTGKICEKTVSDKIYCEVLTTNKLFKIEGKIIERGKLDNMPYLICEIPYDIALQLGNSFLIEVLTIPHEQYAYRWKDVRATKKENNKVIIESNKIGYLYNQRNEQRYKIKINGWLLKNGIEYVRGTLKDISVSGAGFLIDENGPTVNKNDILSIKINSKFPEDILKSLGLESTQDFESKQAKVVEVQQIDYNQLLVHLNFL